METHSVRLLMRENELEFKQKLDLHNHTKYSDGELSAAELIVKKIEQGIHVIGITDHFEDIDNLEEYFSGIHHLAQQYKSSAKVIPGIELELDRQHVVIYGEEFIKKYCRTGQPDFSRVSAGYPYCLIIAHPIMSDLSDDLLKAAHGIEITFSGCLHPEYSTIDMISDQYHLFKIASSDTHRAGNAFGTCTEICGVNILSEEHVIRLLADKKFCKKVTDVRYHVSDIRYRYSDGM